MSERLFTYDRFTDLIPLWRLLILPIMPKDPVRCLEIGSYEGRSACWILDTIVKQHPMSHLDCVDLWSGLEEQERLFDRNLSLEAQVTKHKDFSVHFLAPRVFDPPTYDFISIDGDRRGEIILTDLVLGWRSLKKRGVMAIDGYKLKGASDAEPPKARVAIDAFLKLYPEEIRILEIGRQVIVQKRAQPLNNRQGS